MPNSHRPARHKTVLSVSVGRCESSHRPTGAICVGVRPAVAPAVPAPPDDAERTSRAVGPTQFTPPHQTRQNSPVCHVCCAGVNWKTALNVFRDFKFSVGNSLYKSMVRPHVEFANSVWCPYKIGDSKEIEKIQKRATKLVIKLKNKSYIDRLIYLNLPDACEVI